MLLLMATCDRVRPALKRAGCERKAGHTLKAMELVEEHLAKKPRDKKALKLREALRGEVVTVECFSEPDGALVSVDDADPAGSTPLTVTLDAGRHVFHFTHDGYVALEREETAVAGTRPKLTAVLEKVPAPRVDEPLAAPVAALAPAPQVIVAPGPPTSETPKPAHSSAPLVIGSAGIFIAIGGGVLILTSALSPVFDVSARNRQWVGYGLVGAGAAAGLAAIIWLLIDRRPGAASDR